MLQTTDLWYPASATASHLGVDSTHTMPATQRRRNGHHDDDEVAGLLSAPVADLEALRLRTFDILQQRCEVQFDDDCSEHMSLLHNLWKSSFPTAPFQLPSERWAEIGFQGRDPRSDLRGCGVVGLRHLCQTLDAHRASIDATFVGIPQSDVSAFPLSIASINCTAMLLSYLQLAPKLAMSFLPARVEAPQASLVGPASIAMPASMTCTSRGLRAQTPSLQRSTASSVWALRVKALIACWRATIWARTTFAWHV